ncbi:MAG: hypothetical protein IT374_15780 [Polyangiaceae bacterium]|nr:hypothetical protein [Polyangiaceae bacterium]
MRVAVLIVPAVTFAAATLALLGLARPRTLLAARLSGGPTTEAGSVRLSCVRRAVGVEDAVPLSDLDVQLGPHVSSTRCDADGHAELPLPRGEAGPIAVRVAHGGEVLASGRVVVTLDDWLRGAVTRRARVRGGGRLDGHAEIPGGALATEQTTEVRLVLRGGSGAATLEANGADLGVARLVDGTTEGAPTLSLAVPVTPRFHQVTLTARRADPDETWQGRLPVVAGQPMMTAIEPRGSELRVSIAAPGRRTHAYVRFDAERGRRQARRIALAGDERATHGEATLTDTGERPAWIVVGDSPDLPPDESTGAPLPGNPTLDGRVVQDVPWLDGMPAVRAADERRTTTVVRLVIALVASGGLLEVFLVLDASRAARDRLAAHLASVGDDAPARPEQARPWLPLVLGLLAISFAFALVSLLFTLKA